jgi:TBC1 domain family member 10
LTPQKSQQEHAPQLYFKLLDFDGNPDTVEMIVKDVSRTLSDLGLFTEDLSAGNNRLYNVLKAYANYDNEVSYV